ncbi:MAG: alpha/beta fold hydrolase [Candidatus Odinarchaeota archaeon]
MKLKDGHKLGYAEAGDLNGKPIFHFHGHPGSRLEINFFGEKSKEHGVHIITVDRPGFGLSDFQIKRTLLDWADDVVKLADHLELDKFAVTGISGGEPYTVVCAYKIPEKIINCGIIVGITPINFSKKGMILSNRIIFFIGKWLPFLLRRITKMEMKLFEDPKAIKKLTEILPESDKKFLDNPELLEIFIEESKEGFRSGLDGLVLDNRLYSKPWGFKLNEISPDLQVHL